MDSQSAPRTGALRLASSSPRGIAEFRRLLDRLPAGAYMCDNIAVAPAGVRQDQVGRVLTAARFCRS
jgi:hypothetical protein